jgi:uncharacterized protein (DUF433 family)
MSRCNPHVKAGVPCVAGTRVPTRGPWNLWCSGYSIAAIEAEYPHLARRAVWAAVVFEYRRRLAHVRRIRPRRRLRSRGPRPTIVRRW